MILGKNTHPIKITTFEHLNIDTMKHLTARIITFALTALSPVLSYAGDADRQYDFPFRNPALSIEERVDDLISRMSLEEKVAQMQNTAPAIPSLGIPAYNWWNECLHGVGRSNDHVTVFPQAIGIAATFDEAAVLEMGNIIATEARAIYNEANRTGKEGWQYKGLTFWTPNVNIFRDPRWGRGQETYGEDPYLTSFIGKAMVLGLQGDDPVYLKTSACAKHFAVHSGPEPERHVFNSEVSEYDLWDTYLPAFRALVTEAGVSSVMGAYNRFRGQPCCANDYLTQILREDWGFTGYVTSDCGAIDDFFKYHKTHPDAATSAADAVRHGTDLDCGFIFSNLTEAVERGLITEDEIDKSLARLMSIRFRLGAFDPTDDDPYASLPYTVLESPGHQAHALEMARKSMVLLKNNGILPLDSDQKCIAVIGPNAEAPDVLLGNYNGFPSHIVTPLEGIKKRSGAEIIYMKGSDYTDGKADSEAIDEAIGRADLVIYVGGISPRLEGEQGDAGKEKLSGFRGGDRTSIMLPAVQTEVMKQVKAVGKPLVFISMSGSAIAFPWEAENADAIIQAWYGGQSAGTAIADILWGDCNPSGRLPVTFYADDSQLPDFTDYSMGGRTYRYFKGKPLYPFGYGLSYTVYEYGKPEIISGKPVTGEDITVVTTVKNTGDREGEEVLQLYLSYPDAPAPKPLRALKGVKRVRLMPGEEQTVEFILDSRDLSLVREDGISVCRPGTVEIYIGGSQPESGAAVERQTTEINIRGKEIELPR